MDALVGSLPPGLHLVVREAMEIEGELLAEEAALVASALGKRREEFRAGRVLAREVLAELGFPPAPLLRDGEGAPLWPRGVLASLSHTTGTCVVCAGRAVDLPGLRSVGVDLERRRALDPALERRIATPGEREWLAGLREGRAEALLLLFSGKEALYKAQYPLTGRYLGFQGAEVDVNLAGGELHARIVDEECRALGGGACFEGRFARLPGQVLTVVWSRG